MEGALEAAEGCNFKLAEERAAGEAGGPCGFKRVANGRDAAGLGGTKEWARDTREKVGVLVCVDVGDGEALLLKRLDLRGGLLLNVGLRDAATLEVEDETRKGAAEAIAGG